MVSSDANVLIEGSVGIKEIKPFDPNDAILVSGNKGFYRKLENGDETWVYCTRNSEGYNVYVEETKSADGAMYKEGWAKNDQTGTWYLKEYKYDENTGTWIQLSTCKLYDTNWLQKKD